MPGLLRHNVVDRFSRQLYESHKCLAWASVPFTVGPCFIATWDSICISVDSGLCWERVQAHSYWWVSAPLFTVCPVCSIYWAILALLSFHPSSHPFPPSWNGILSLWPILDNESSSNEWCSSLTASSACPRMTRPAPDSPSISFSFSFRGPILLHPLGMLLPLGSYGYGAVGVYWMDPKMVSFPCHS